MARPKKPANGTVADHEEDEGEEARLAAEQIRLDNEDKAKAAAISTVAGDIRDFILDTLRFEQDKRPWNQRSEAEQRETGNRVMQQVQAHVRTAVEIISAAGLPTIKATLESVTIKDGIKLNVTMDRHNEQRYSVFDCTGGTILLVMASADQFMGERAPVKINPDQLDIEGALVEHSDEDADKVERRGRGGRAAHVIEAPNGSPLN